MTRRFVLSDHHFAHDRIWSFMDRDNQLLRPWAGSSAEGDAMMVDRHNAAVRPGDTVYFLGDVAIRASGLALLDAMNGRKVLIRGNHDIFRLKQYASRFADIRGTHKLEKLILSHYPLHRSSIPSWCLANVHGHTHARIVTRRRLWRDRPDPLYFNACIERLGPTPIQVDEIIARIEAVR